MSNKYEDIEKIINTEENIADIFKNVLVDNLNELEEKTGMSTNELMDYIERIMVM